MKLSAKEVNILKDKCSYGGDYEGLNKRLEYDTPKTLKLSLNEKDLLSQWLEEASTETEILIKGKLLKSNGDYR